MSYVVSIRRTESQPPFGSEELERVAQAHESLSVGRSVLTWSNAEGVSVELFVAPRELRADRIPSAVIDEVLGVLRAIARELDARVVGEEGEDLTHGELTPSPPGSPWRVLLGGIVAVVAIPLMLLFALVRLPWVLWKARRSLK